MENKTQEDRAAFRSHLKAGGYSPATVYEYLGDLDAFTAYARAGSLRRTSPERLRAWFESQQGKSVV